MSARVSFGVERHAAAARLLTVMPAVPWMDLVELRPRPHLVMAALPGDSELHPDARLFLATLKRVMANLPIDGTYAATIDRSGGRANILCAFDRRVDADQLADRLSAAPLENTGGWASARRFLLDADAYERLLDVGGPPKVRRRPRSTEPPVV